MLIDTLTNLIVDATKKRDEDRVNALKYLKNELMKEQKSGKPYTDEVELKKVINLVSTYKEAAKTFKESGREDLYEKNIKELAVLKEFAPKEATDEEIATLAEKIIQNFIKTNGFVSMKDMKTILSEVQQTYPTANGKIVSNVLKTKM